MGPALILEAHGAVVVDLDWSAEVDGVGAIILRRLPARSSRAVTIRPPATVELELFTHRFRAIVETMGERLRRTALSTNVKERLDFSCALLDAAGELVVNAPHIPVHLGALGVCVRKVRAAIALEPGDVVVTNHPAFGGSHLPDITVISPIFTAAGELLAHVASRAHHAEIGGCVPGSMPPHARTLAEEGVVISPRYLVRRGVADWDGLRALLEAPPFPSRAVEDNLADLRAAVAANHSGVEAMGELARAAGVDVVRCQLALLRRKSSERLRATLRRRPPGVVVASEKLDDGAVLRVRIEIDGDHARINFAGSSDVHPGNLNATPAIVRSVVLYVLRLLIDEPLPLNEGLLEPIELEIPPGMLNPTFPADPTLSPALFGGNVETSQRLAGLLLKALGLAASSQGTMNNVILGTSRFGYYETVCGGCGAGPGFHGASAVHSHMTNTRITDPEVLEHRYPVRLERFAIRRGSGGEGRWRGGDGVVRELVFLEPVTLSVLGQHRTQGPYGLAGGNPGAAARLRLVRGDGTVETLRSADGGDVQAGDRLILETPGGGGHGLAL